ncbi:MAG: ABC transporter ATP-binding protein, partial [Rhizobiaceae bacterium]|nr:ABC transporter ATP-binding protein [Rhizobiaceae bacterium]
MEQIGARLAAALPRSGEPLVRLSGVSMAFGRVTALHPVDLSIHRGDFLALLGPSGCGKTTLLKTIGGFLTPTTGSIEIEGEDVTRLPPERRRTGMVFQGYGLFPHMTVRQNIAYGLKVARRPKEEIERRVAAMIDLVRLQGMAERMPAALSGGQQQRVALARSLVMEPAVLLLDESLAALDLALRKAMQEELRSLHRSIGGTFVFVTHDQHEAMAMANRIAVMKNGRIVQQGTPQEIYTQPQSEFVAGFIGDANLLRGERRAG